MHFRQVLAGAGFSSPASEAALRDYVLVWRRARVASLRHAGKIKLFKIAAFVAPVEHHRHGGQCRKAQYFTFHQLFPRLSKATIFPASAHHSLPGASMLVQHRNMLAQLID